MTKIIPLIALAVLTGKMSVAQDMLKVSAGSSITVESGAILYVNGGINLDNTGVLNNAGVITIEKTSSGTADFTDNSTVPYIYSTGKFVFKGNGVQSVKSINQFARIDIDGGGLTLLSDINSGLWYLKAGRINTGNFIAIANNTAPTAVQADAANANFAGSWINGNLRRSVAPASVNNYQFPVGDATSVKLAEMVNLTANPLAGVNYVTVNFGPKPGNDAGLSVVENGVAYSTVNNGGVWYFTPDAVATAGKYDVKLFFNGFNGFVDNSFGILSRLKGSSNAADWVLPAGAVLPTTGAAGRTVASGYARRNSMADFGQFGIGTSLMVLPLQLLNFYAVKNDKKVLLKWTTSNEVNTSHFEIYRARPGVSMQYMGKVDAGSLPGQLNYAFTDIQPLSGTNFYQLKMVDKDNLFKWSGIASIKFDEPASFSVFPNPVVNNIAFVNYSGSEIKAVKLVAPDGKQIPCTFSNQSNNHWKVQLPFAIAKGTYTLQILTNDGEKNSLIMVQ